MELKRILPPGYTSGPIVQLGRAFEIDIGSFEYLPARRNTSAGVATLPRPKRVLQTKALAHDVFEVRVYERTASGRRLVAAIELVSPANKDRKEHRRAFTAKCATFLKNEVAVSIVDVVTQRRANLASLLLRQLSESDVPNDSPIYATTLRAIAKPRSHRVEVWDETLNVGQPLPTLPIWLNEKTCVTLDLEATYRATCEVLDLS